MSTAIGMIETAERFIMPQGHDAYMAIMSAEGDLKHTWTRSSTEEVNAMREIFDNFTKNKKYRAYKVKKNGEAGEVMSAFDPSAELMILRPELVGG